MAKKTKKQKNSILEVKKASKSSNAFDYLRFGESYTSLILGIIVVIVAIVLSLGIFRNRNIGQVSSTSTQNLNDQTQQGFQNTVSTTPAPYINKNESVYVIEEGDSLWAIAEKEYGSGYNWVDIAQRNKLSNADVLITGNKLIIPSVVTKTAESDYVYGNDFSQNTSSISTVREEKSILVGKYTIQSGDSLWSIAVRTYGDGYRWVDIAEKNNIPNPDIINEGTSLNLPRK